MSKLNWEDIVFERRNQDYGAYSLRKAYGGRVIAAFVGAVFILGFVMALPAIRRYFASAEEVKAPVKTIKYTDLAAPPPIDKNTPPPPRVELPPVKEVIKFLPPTVTEKEVVEEEVPTVAELKQNEISTESSEGNGEIVFDEPVEEATEEPGEDPNKVYTIVEQPPEFPGGMAAMMKFVSQNMRYPAQARRMGTEGSVFVSFVVGPDGRISEVQTIKGISADCDKEARRVIEAMPAWKPGKQNGKAVRVRFVLPIKFLLG